MRTLLICISTLFFSFSVPGEEEGDAKGKKAYPFVGFLFDYLDITYHEKELHFEDVIYVAVKKQKLYLIQDSAVVGEYDISTSSKGIGMRNNSFKTPHGLHRVKEKIGKGVPLGGIFEHRRYIGEKATIYKDSTDSDKDLITSRILWLDGMERGVNKGGNKDSYRRGIYIHGTHEEGKIGSPASHGCIRMRNQEVIELFKKVKVGMPVIILNN